MSNLSDDLCCMYVICNPYQENVYNAGVVRRCQADNTRTRCRDVVMQMLKVLRTALSHVYFLWASAGASFRRATLDES